MYDVQQMITQLSRYWWSPRHPSTYTVTGANGKPAGIGLLSHENPAAFNITWAIHPLITFNDHKTAIMSWSQLNRQLDCRAGNEYLDWAITSRTREEFKVWYKLNKTHIRIETRMFLDKV